MTIQAQSADGTVHEFPDGTNPAVVDKVMKSYAQSNPMRQAGMTGGSSQPNQSSITGDNPRWGHGGLNEIWPSIGSGVTSGVMGLLGLPGDVLKATGHPGYLPTSEEFNKLSGPAYHPQTTTGQYLQTGGSFTPAFFGGEASIPARLVRIAAPAVASEAAGQATKGTAAEPWMRLGGALVGGTAQGLGEFGPQALQALRNGSLNIPTIEGLKSAAQAAYKQIDDSGMVIKQSAVKDLADKVAADLQSSGIHPMLQPRANAALKALQEAAANGDQSLQSMEVLRRIARGAADTLDKSDKMMARKIIDHIDDFVGNLNEDHVSGAVDQKALDALTNARDLWSRASKGQTIQDLINKAKVNSQSMIGDMPGLGYGKALQTQFRKLYNNPRGIARFSTDEQAAIKKVATGGPIENVARVIGKLAPDQVMPLGVGAGLGFLTGGPVGAVAAPVAGGIAKATSSAITARNARIASELMRAGPSNVARSAIPPFSPQAFKQVLLDAFLSQASHPVGFPSMAPALIANGSMFNPQKQPNSFFVQGTNQ